MGKHKSNKTNKAKGAKTSNPFDLLANKRLKFEVLNKRVKGKTRNLAR